MKMIAFALSGLAMISAKSCLGVTAKIKTAKIKIGKTEMSNMVFRGCLGNFMSKLYEKS